MPTVLLLDVSLSMSRPIQSVDPSETHTRYTLAASAIRTFLEYLSIHCKLEYVSLVAYSSLYEVVCPFTRDYEMLKSKLHAIEEVDRTCIDTALHGVNSIVLNEWGHQTPVQIILLTDGSVGAGGAVRMRALPLPPPYPAKLHVLPLAAPSDPALPHALPLYQKMIELASSGTGSSACGMNRGAIYSLDQLSLPAVTSAVGRLCEQHYSEAMCTIRCGQLESRVQLFPAFVPRRDDAGNKLALAPTINVVGFVTAQELGTPISMSKHLIIPQTQNGPIERRETYGTKASSKEGASSDSNTADDDTSDPSKIPNFCVLLHGALKVEGTCAIVQVGEGWYGSVAVWCEQAKARRSSLVLSVLQPGPHAAPWLGPLDQLGPLDAAPAAGGGVESFPVRASRSYGSGGGGGGAAWARPHALTADVQKVLRHARKLPDKTQHFYKELNRLRRAAISLGFVELLGGVAGALERECAAAAPAAALQLAHAARALTDPRTALDAKLHVHPPPSAAPPHQPLTR